MEKEVRFRVGRRRRTWPRCINSVNCQFVVGLTGERSGVWSAGCSRNPICSLRVRTHARRRGSNPPATPVGFLFRELASQIRPFRGIESHPAKGSLIQPPFLPLFTRCFLLPFLLLAFLLSFFFFCSAFFLSGILLPRPRFFLGGVFACARSTLEKQLQQSALFDESERSKRSFFNDSSFIRCYLPLWL